MRVRHIAAMTPCFLILRPPRAPFSLQVPSALALSYACLPTQSSMSSLIRCHLQLITLPPELYCWPVRYALISTNIFLIGISPNVLIAERDRETSMVRIPSARPHFLWVPFVIRKAWFTAFLDPG